jgi:hypothetical protein
MVSGICHQGLDSEKQFLRNHSFLHSYSFSKEIQTKVWALELTNKHPLGVRGHSYFGMQTTLCCWLWRKWKANSFCEIYSCRSWFENFSSIIMKQFDCQIVCPWKKIKHLVLPQINQRAHMHKHSFCLPKPSHKKVITTHLF